jgi:hypothetical protein
MFLLLFKPKYHIPQQTSTRALLFLVSVSFRPPPSTKHRLFLIKKSQISVYPGEWGEQTDLKPGYRAKYLRSILHIVEINLPAQFTGQGRVES